MKKENKRKASNAWEALLAPQQNAFNDVITCSIYSVILDCKGFLHCVVKGLSVFLKYAKSLFSSVRYINNAETGARTHSQS